MTDLYGFRFTDAARAMRALLQNPDDTEQVFRVIDALSGRSGERLLQRFAKHPAGKRLLAARPQLIDRLADRASLEKLPPGSLGREYLRFLDAEGITAEGLRKASLDARRRERGELPPELEFLRTRMRDTHDLWHTVTGYKGDLIGEASLLSFILAQTWNPGIGFIVAIALLRGREPSVRKLIVNGFVRGMRAQWLPAVEWEALLAMPLDVVRERLAIDGAPVYRPVRSSEYRELRMAAAAA